MKRQKLPTPMFRATHDGIGFWQALDSADELEILIARWQRQGKVGIRWVSV